MKHYFLKFVVACVACFICLNSLNSCKNLQYSTIRNSEKKDYPFIKEESPSHIVPIIDPSGRGSIIINGKTVSDQGVKFYEVKEFNLFFETVPFFIILKELDYQIDFDSNDLVRISRDNYEFEMIPSIGKIYRKEDPDTNLMHYLYGGTDVMVYDVQEEDIEIDTALLTGTLFFMQLEQNNSTHPSIDFSHGFIHYDTRTCEIMFQFGE